MKSPKKILIVIQRSNGDVFLSITLINLIYEYFHSPQIDLLVNDDTYSMAKLLPNINFIHQFSYQKKRNYRWKQEKQLLTSLPILPLLGRLVKLGELLDSLPD